MVKNCECLLLSLFSLQDANLSLTLHELIQSDHVVVVDDLQWSVIKMISEQ